MPLQLMGRTEDQRHKGGIGSNQPSKGSTTQIPCHNYDCTNYLTNYEIRRISKNNPRRFCHDCRSNKKQPTRLRCISCHRYFYEEPNLTRYKCDTCRKTLKKFSIIKFCRNCGKLVHGRKRMCAVKYCSSKCCSKYNYYRTYPKFMKYTKKCQFCGDSFTVIKPKSTKQKFCSVKCKNRRSYLRRLQNAI